MKKAQIKSFETIAVLMVFFFLLVFGVIFYSRIQVSSLEQQRSENAQIHAVNVALKMSYLPELDCVQTGIVKQNCFDLLKVRHLASMTLNPPSVETRLMYAQLFETSTINITRLSEDGSVVESILLYDNPGTSSKHTIHMPVKLFDPVSERYDFGYALVSVYEN